MQRGYPGRGGRDGDRRDPAPRTSSYHDRRRDLTPPRGDRAREREASPRRGGPPRGHDISPRRSGAGWGYSGGSRQGGPGAGRVVSSPYRADPGWGVVSRSSGGGRAASPRPRDSGWDLCTLPSREGRQLERERHHRTRSPRSPKRRDSPRQQGMTPSPRRMFERQREDDTRERHSGCKETVPEQRKKRQGAEEAEGKWQHLREDHSPNKRSVSRPRRPMSRSPPLPQLNRERAQPAPTRPAESIKPGSGKEAESKLEARGSEYQERKEYKDEVKGQELPGKSNKDHKRGNQGGQSSREPAPETSSSRKEGKSKTKQKSVAPPPAIGDTASPATLMKWKKGDVLYCPLCLDKEINSPYAYRNRTNLRNHMLGRHGMTPRPRAPYVMRDGKWKVPYEIRQPTQGEWEKFIADRDLKKKKDQARGSARTSSLSWKVHRQSSSCLPRLR